MRCFYMADEKCRQKILSEDYLDFIVPDYRERGDIQLPESQWCIQELGFGYGAIHIDTNLTEEITIAESGYNGIPSCYSLLDEEAMDEAGISAVQNFPALELKGNGIMVGFVDTGIDFQNPVFQNEIGDTRITAIWDQTIQTGMPPEGFDYGSEYLRSQIHDALQTENPYVMVPSKDSNGHGTFLASLAAGRPDTVNQFQGAAPETEIAVVKLKEAKASLKDFYAIRENAVCYQETDILQGLLYLHRLALKKNMPLVMCVALGTNFGGHNGESVLSRILGSYAGLRDRCVVIAGGNEANERHHFLGTLEKDVIQEIEIRVEKSGGSGFVAEFWSRLPNIVNAYLISPTGEKSPNISIRQGERYTFTFAFDRTVVDIEYRLLLNNNNSFLIFMRFSNPSQGIWRLGVIPQQVGDKEFHIWISMKEFLENEVYFLESNPDYTLTEPGSTKGAITVSYYDGRDNSVDINSGRGYTRGNLLKPDFVSPGVQVTGALPGGRFAKRSGSSVAAGITAGASALVMEWLKKQPAARTVSTSQVASILILGAQQNVFSTYPNRQWGFGTMDVYESLERLRRL